MAKLQKPQWIVVAAAVIGLSGWASAGTIRDDRADSLYTARSALTQYASVGALLIDTVAGTGFDSLGSGVLVAPSWVLTAAHVTGAAPIATGAIQFRLGANYNSPTATYNADYWVTVPGWTGSFTAGNDLALIRLSSPVVGTTPTPIYTGSSEKGLTGTHVGYGRTGTGLTGAITLDGKRRAGDNVIDNYGGEVGNGVSLGAYSSNILFTDFDNPSPSDPTNWLGGTTALDLEYMIGPGDSGGGFFVDVDSTTFVAGIHSFYSSVGSAPPPTGVYNNLSGSTRVSAHASWVQSTIPEPASASLLAAATGLLLVRRRR